MTDKLKQTIKEEIAKLPKEMQEAINAVDWVKISEEIGKKMLISDDEINNFQVETLLVLIGGGALDDYARNIENEVGTSAEEAKNISDEAVERIFTPIADISIENIKRSLKEKNPNWQQSLNFILSGGNYAALVEEENKTVSSAPEASDKKINSSTNTQKITDIKSKFTI